MKILVTGATGRVGQFLVNQLHEVGYQVVALTRNPAKANFPEGVEVLQGDLTQPSTLETALKDVKGLHLINFGGDDYTPLETGEQIVKMAQEAGVERVTVLLGGQKGALENAVESSPMAWALLQPVEFMTGIIDWAASIRKEQCISLPFPDRKTAIVHEADIAAVALKALTEDGHAGKTYTITGPDVLSPRKIIGMISQTLRQDIQLVELNEAEARIKLKAEGYPQEVIEFFMWIYGNTPEIGYTVVPTVEEITRHPARTCAQWVQENIRQFRD